MALPSISELIETLFPGPSPTDLLGYRVGTDMASIVAERGGDSFRIPLADDAGAKPRIDVWTQGDGDGRLDELTVVVSGEEDDASSVEELLDAIVAHLDEHVGESRVLSNNDAVRAWDLEGDVPDLGIFVETYDDGGPCVSINLGGIESDYLPAQTEQLSLSDVQAHLASFHKTGETD